MRNLRWVVDQLPGIKPRLASVALKNGLVPGVMDDVHFMHGELGPSFLVGPDAARLIHAAYHRGVFQMEAGRRPETTAGLDAYILNDDGLRSEAAAHRRTREGSDPFSDWRAMEELFRRQGHPVPGWLTVHGIRVERRTGTARDPRPDEIRFHWTGQDGPRALHRRHGVHPDDQQAAINEGTRP